MEVANKRAYQDLYTVSLLKYAQLKVYKQYLHEKYFRRVGGKSREEGPVKNKAAYLALGVNLEGKKDIDQRERRL